MCDFWTSKLSIPAKIGQLQSSYPSLSTQLNLNYYSYIRKNLQNVFCASRLMKDFTSVALNLSAKYSMIITILLLQAIHEQIVLSGAFSDLCEVVVLWSISIIGLRDMIQSVSKLLALIYSKKAFSID